MFISSNKTVNPTLYDVEQTGIILKKDINKLSKKFDLTFAKKIVFSIETFVDDDGKTIERLIIESIIYADRIIEEDDDMDKKRKKLIIDEDPNNDLLQEILKSINDLKTEMNQKFEKVDKKFEEIDEKFEKIDQRFEKMEKNIDQKFKDFKVEIMNHISEEFKKHIKEYHS